MNSQRKRYIRELTKIIREQLGLTEPPIDVKKTVEILGGRIEEDDSLEFDTDAIIKKTEDGGFIIKINPNQGEQRKRFTLAHELGHLFLHMGYGVDAEKWEKAEDWQDTVYARHGKGLLEYEANEFAATFLMPENIFREEAKKHKEGNSYHVTPIANAFNVSIDAVKTRGKWLGIFAWD